MPFDENHFMIPNSIYLLFYCFHPKSTGRLAQRRAAADEFRHKRYGGIQYQEPYFPTYAKN